jgi:hypothetical protein
MSRYTMPKLETKGELVDITKGIPLPGQGDPAHPVNPAFKVNAAGSVGFNL